MKNVIWFTAKDSSYAPFMISGSNVIHSPVIAEYPDKSVLILDPLHIEPVKLYASQLIYFECAACKKAGGHSTQECIRLGYAAYETFEVFDPQIHKEMFP